MISREFELRLDDAAYPRHLRDSIRPPALLYGIGDVRALVPGLAVIGSRRATPYGIACARRFASAAAGWGVTIISGGAIGCDSAAHEAALGAGGASIAVLGCGAEVDYPQRSAGLLASMRSGRGAVVSELPWTTPPRPQQFPSRNRIIAGLSAAVLVVEAALPSGTFSTADAALDSGRDVLAVPGSILHAGSTGCNRLIRQGATPITDEADLFEALAAAGLLAGDDPGPPSIDLPPARDPVAAAVAATPMSVDAIAEATGLPVRDVLARLAVLEAGGTVARYANGTYGPCG